MKIKELFEEKNKIPAVRDLPPIDPAELANVLAKVRKSPEYKQLIQHASDMTALSKTREKNGTLTFLFNSGLDEFYIYSNGQIRKYGTDRMTKVNSPVPDADIYKRYINCIKTILTKVDKIKQKAAFSSGGIVEISSPSLTSLSYVDFPDEIKALRIGENVKIRDFGGCPNVINSIICNAKGLESLHGLQKDFDGFITISNAKIKTLEGLPVNTSELALRVLPKLTSFKNINMIVPNLKVLQLNLQNPIESILSLLKIKTLQEIELSAGMTAPTTPSDFVRALQIVQKYLKSKDLLSCQDELIENGLKDYARL